MNATNQTCNVTDETECGTWLPSGIAEECGIRLIFTNPVGGRIAQLANYPWMALLGYSKDNGVEYRCAGSVINRLYILTSAHCVKDEIPV